MRLVVAVESEDRPGLLQKASSVLSNLGVNILLSLGYVHDGRARLLFIGEAYGPIDLDSVRDRMERALQFEVPGVDVDAAQLGPDAAGIIARFLEARPELIGALEGLLDPVDIVDVLSRLPEDRIEGIVRRLRLETLALVMEYADKQLLESIISALDVKTIARALTLLDPDEAVDVLQKMSDDMRRRILSLLPPEYRTQAGKLLEYPPDTAGGIMTTSVPVVKTGTTIGEALAELARNKEYDVRDTIVVVGGDGKLIGLVDVADVLSYSPDTRVDELARKPRITVDPWTDRETVARLMLRYYQRRLPVVDAESRFMGLITIEDVVYVLEEEATEDIAKIVGSEIPIERYITARVVDLVKARLPWLLVIYLIESVTANVLKSYEHVIATAAILTAFIPLVMGTGGNVGSQAVGLIIRALALGEISERSLNDILLVVRKEIKTAAMIAVVFAAVGFAFAAAVSGSTVIASIVALTLLIVIHLADLAGALLPIAARRLGLDPASISSPLITTVVDVSVAFIYMNIALALLR